MSIPKKGSRKIHIGGIDYRWTIRNKPTYCEGAFATEMTAAVELYASPVSTLIIGFGSPRPDNWLEREGMKVTPKTIKSQIELALKNGWEPKNRKGFKWEYQDD